MPAGLVFGVVDGGRTWRDVTPGHAKQVYAAAVLTPIDPTPTPDPDRSNNPKPHALDALWSHQCGIENLLRCMHPNLIIVKKVSLGPSQGKRQMICLTKPRLKPTDWGNFDAYARRIKKLRMPKPVHPYLESTPAAPDVYRALAMCDHHSRPYFPHLVHLTYQMPELSPDMLGFCATLIGPSIRSLALSLYEDQADLITVPLLLSYALRLSPSLQQLELSLGPSPDALSLLSSALQSLNQVRSLSLTLHAAPPVELWDALSAAPSITRLTLGAPADSLGSIQVVANLEAQRKLDFKQITHLTFQNISVTDCTHIMSCASLASVIGIHMTCRYLDELEGCNLIQAITSSCSFDLCELSIGSSRVPGSGIPADQLRTLWRTFRKITHLDISVPSRVDDTLVKDIAHTLPGLRKLGLTYHQDQRSRGQLGGVTSEGLARLVHDCPHLHELSLDMDLRYLEVGGEQPLPSSRNAQIKQLDVGSSRVADAATTAAFLTGLFPNLTTISQHNTPEHAQRWLEVTRLLSIFRRVRDDERRRMLTGGDTDVNHYGGRP
ncbi:hypothetical protein EVJ58_g2457 [Rhodofomes roseus]|uniref:RNI-like protein n=1 Tax=Rhodofomes roseus TaxID=34475 RepID=A0A4Y9YSC3_9APHY|nr:hypothetical protein EVJ58_g2457 [Rhodofomes roseus]